jgi:hypothetical protein
MTIWNILRLFGIIYGRLVWFEVIWYIFPIMVCLDQEKYGNPGIDFKDIFAENCDHIIDPRKLGYLH